MSAPHLSAEQILLGIEGGSSEPAAAAAHLAECPACREAEATLRKRLAALESLSAPLRRAPPRTFPSKKKRARAISPLRAVIEMAAMIAVLAGTALLLNALAPWAATVERGSGSLAPGRKFGSGSVLSATDAPARLRFRDGTTATIDKGTRLEKLSERSFFLSSGRVLVSTKTGFAVDTTAGRVVALGTAFLVEAGPGPPVVTVVRGKVRVEPAGGAPFEVKEGEEAALAAGTAPTPSDVQRRAAWARDFLFPANLDDEPLSKVFALLEEVSPYRIEAPEPVRHSRVQASIGGKSVEAILRAISEAFGFPHRIEGDRVIFGN